ncbi:hypothetical protein DSCA_52470 [Desulfosarcina alkanivorans]|uniref:Uncharacterized protein n=1 Tax=Desulfosarcina alkanivorans TaxID=571177 RepID=A0A5K7Z3W2_9BACT|nr:hypothetical protein DSCA_52470 [Desulfosarcina alkanivorans]
MISGTAVFLGLFNNLAIFIVLIAVYSVLNSFLRTWGGRYDKLQWESLTGYFPA